MADEKPDKADKEEKASELRELQNRIMGIEKDLKGLKGAEADNIRSIAKTEVKALEDQIAELRASMNPVKKADETEGGLFDWLDF